MYLLPLLWWPVSRYDEGILLSGAQRLVAGEAVPGFLDHLRARPVRGAGRAVPGRRESLAASRTWELLVRALLPVLGFLVAARLRGPRAGLGVWLLLLLGLWQFPPTNYPVFPALAAVLGATSLLLDRRWAAAGALVGVAALFRHDIGAYGAGAHILALIVVERAGLKGYLLGLVAVTVPAALALSLLVPWREWWPTW